MKWNFQRRKLFDGMPTIASKILITEKIIEIDNPSSFKWIDVFHVICKQVQEIKNKYVIKVNLVKTTRNKLFFRLIYLEDFYGFIENPFVPEVEVGSKPASTRDISCLIVPTGIGAAFGGYAGDANPLAKLFASANKYLLTHPNVVNGAVLSDPPSNMIYLEGFLLDQFLLGNINMIPTKQNKIGVIFDRGINKERLEYEVNVLNALRAFYGCDIVAWTLTDKPVVIKPAVNEYSFSTGTIENLETIIEKAFKLKDIGVTAIAICCTIPDIELSRDYRMGNGIDPIGGVESIISHAVSAVTGLVSAHAPVLLSQEVVDYKKIAPVSASEYIAQTFLPSVISGLRYVPKIVVGADRSVCPSQQKSFQDIGNIIVPYNAFGSAGVFYLNEIFQNVILIRENKVCLDVNPDHLNLKSTVCDSYNDLIDAKKIKESGIDVSVLKRPIERIQTV